ncbi:MAG: hypothetical protein AMXMBFR7_02560 [Planctomycetota bacterium]
MTAPLQAVRVDCRNMLSHIVADLEGRLDPERSAELREHADACPRCRKAAAQFRDVHAQLHGTLGAGRISPDFSERSQRRLAERTAALETGGTTSEKLSAVAMGATDEELDPPAPGFAEALEKRLGAAPWWIVSGAFHALLLLLVTLIGMAIYRAQDDAAVIVTDLERRPEVEDPKQPLERDIFRKPVPIETAENVVVESPVVTHEEVEIAEHVETANESDLNTARGDEQAISDVMLGGVGTVAALGMGGGGGGAFGQRLGGGRMRMAVRGGGNKATESAVDAALAWLARNQEPGGQWDAAKHGASFHGSTTGVSALALLAFLGAGHTEKVGKYKDNVKRGIEWLRSVQNDKGLVCMAGDRPSYSHPIAGLALAEAAAMGRVAETRDAAQKAVNYSEEIQYGEGSERLAWRYSPKEALGDTSVTGWYVMQLKSAKIAGLNVDPAAFQGVMAYLDTVMLPLADAQNGYGGNRYGYRKDAPAAPNGVRVKDDACNTAIGCLGRLFLGVPANDIQGGVEHFLTTPGGGVPDWNKPHFYYWYYATLTCFQSGGDQWKRWNEAMKPTLLNNQCKGGADDGSWPIVGPWVQSEGGGRVMSTALGAMCLEVYYRYLPIYKK